MCVTCVCQLYHHKSKKLYIISSLIVQNLLVLSVVSLKLDKLSPKLSSMIVVKISSRCNYKLKILFNNNVILILTAVQILTPAGWSTIQLSSGSVYPEIMSDAID